MLTWTTAELADILGIGKTTIRTWMRTERLHAVFGEHHEGHLISDRSLFEFFKDERNAKYKKIFLTKLQNETYFGDKLAKDVADYLRKRGYIE